MGGYRDIFASLPAYESDRLIIRRIEKTDAEDMYEYSCSEETTRWLLWSPHSSPSYTKKYIDAIISGYRSRTYFDLAVVLKSENKMIGTCGFARISEEDSSAELGYVISKRYSGAGYASEAAKILLDIGFNIIGLNRIYARYMTENLASLAVMKKIGMQFEGIHRKDIYVKGEYRDIGYCAILADDYFSSENARMPAKANDIQSKKSHFFGF